MRLKSNATGVETTGVETTRAAPHSAETCRVAAFTTKPARY